MVWPFVVVIEVPHHMGMQAATHVKFHDGFGVPINVLEGANDGKDIWIGFSDGDMAIMNIVNKSIGTRWKGHSSGVSCMVGMTHSLWSGDHDVLDYFPLDKTIYLNLLHVIFHLIYYMLMYK